MATANTAFRDYRQQFSHIQDPALQRRLILQAIDEAPLGYAQVRAVLVAGIGFLTDAYDIFAISLVTDMFGLIYRHGTANDPGSCRLSPTDDNNIKLATPVGTIVGQILFGWLADVVGRKRMYGLELLLIIIATFGQCLTADSSAVPFVGVMIFWRVMMGIGIGGDYPISSVITSEFANTRWRGTMIAAVFAMQGIGQLFASIVALIVTTAYHSPSNASRINPCNGTQPSSSHCTYCTTPSPSEIKDTDRMWRLIIGIGVLPACIALYYRLTIPETPRYTFDVNRDVEQAFADTVAWLDDEIDPLRGEGSVADTREERRRQLRRNSDGGIDRDEVPLSSWSDFKEYYSKWNHARILIGTASAWFFMDLAFYGLSLNNPVILDTLSSNSAFSGLTMNGTTPTGTTIHDGFRANAKGNLVLVAAGAIPGYLMTVLTVDKLGRKTIQLMGFAILFILFMVLGLKIPADGTTKSNSNARFALYVLCQFFFCFGPNSTTFIIPGECFPTRYRSTSYGIAAASGKVGAVIAQVIWGHIRTGNGSNHWLDTAMKIFAAFMFLGFFSTLLIDETKGKTLETNASPDHASLSGDEESDDYSTGRSTAFIRRPRQWINSRIKKGTHRNTPLRPWPKKSTQDVNLGVITPKPTSKVTTTQSTQSP